MSYTSGIYYILVIALLIIYYLFPKKIRWMVLLAGNIIFYAQVISRKKQVVPSLITGMDRLK
jgi:inorganic pyrophosphatase/exopolyphosphatase